MPFTRLLRAAILCSLVGCAADAAPIEVDLVVDVAGSAAPVRAGTTCVLRMQPAWRSGVDCQLVLRCLGSGGDEDLFGGHRPGGYAVCDTVDHTFVRALDAEHVRDGDPAVDVDLATGTVTWRGPLPDETATLRMVGEPRPIAAWDEAAR
jgi:hypothetical protein